MANIVGVPRPSKEAELSALRRAIVVERKARYADFQGKHSTFSAFMRVTSDRLMRRYPLDPVWVTVRSLFRQYPQSDVSTRISILNRAEELLEPYWLVATGQSPQNAQGEASAPQARAVEREISGGGGAGPKHSEQGASAPAAGGGGAAGKTSIPAQSKPPGKPGPTVTPGARPVIKTGGGGPSARVSLSSGSAGANKDSGKEIAAKAGYDKCPPAEIPVQYVKGVGPKLASLLGTLDIRTVDDLLRHYPRRHLDFHNRLLIKDLKMGEEVTIFGSIRSVSAFQSKRGNMSILSTIISDGTGSILVIRFVGGKSNKYLLDRYKAQYPKGAQVLASGVVERDEYSHKMKLKNAEVEILSLEGGGELNGGVASLAPANFDDESAFGAIPSSIHAGRLVPVYPLTEGLSLRHLRNVIHNALTTYGAQIEDRLPETLRERFNLMPLREAFFNIHFPEDPDLKDEARRRLVFDELFSIQLQMAHRRYQFELIEDALSLRYEPDQNGYTQKLRQSLPFKLTGAQDRVFNEIARDLASNKPMHRLVQGDVGSGKTIVALLAFMVAIENGYQGAMMAPTEILAEQHYRQFQRLLAPLGLKCALFLGKQGVKERRQVRQELVTGQVHIAVGTHALIEDDVEFQKLGLIIIDEQHRFGVKQRARLKAKSENPELLTMTATPIPRTLALTMHGDLDVSEIDELPPGRKPIKTELFRPSQKKEVWKRVHEEMAKGRQAYIVFPLIDESETLSAKAATVEFEKLRTGEFKDFKIGLMHGKLKSQEKDEVMDAFRRGEYHILVSTTVIEVGVDVPNSTVMVIENADRFGLAQLHQLRGRVGRGGEQSYCFLVSELKSEATRDRLEILTQTNDGFVVAEKDLEIRGPGEFIGYRQSGLPDLILADLVKDAKILEDARNGAIAIMKADPELETFPSLKKMVESKVTGEHAEMMRSG
ncbi:MAG: ATP-dependent DNA helicase RecG [Cyanobacteria bacterium REEB67]|nr:ATP-dependent DNA helicase RecG [Cyanobacteria bacterium REEB67]